MPETPVVSSKPKRNPKAPRQPLPVLDPMKRAATCEEVALGFSEEQARIEALRCLNCRDPKCIEACPLHIDIKGFIQRMFEGDYGAAFEHISEYTPFPGICGRVCQHELFCEKVCLLGNPKTKLEPVAIGSLERFLADYAKQAGDKRQPSVAAANGMKVALVGSGPASLIAAFDLVRKGYRVTVFEALHKLGGVLAYGIPPFRLPREIIDQELDRLRALGVEFRTNFIVGKTETVEELFEEGFAAVFIGTGAGLPHLMGIPGENLIGVYTANEFLTRINLMQAYEFPASDTPVRVGSRTIVVGGGNSAMDAARWAKRLGSESIILFRRGRAELRARLEEIEHAEEEGVKFEFLGAPVRMIGDENGILREVECIRMELGKTDESGRPSPVPIPGSEYRVAVDTLVMAIGQSPNPTVQRATPQLVTKRGKIAIDDSGKTSMENVFAGRRCGARRSDRDPGDAGWAGRRRGDRRLVAEQSGGAQEWPASGGEHRAPGGVEAHADAGDRAARSGSSRDRAALEGGPVHHSAPHQGQRAHPADPGGRRRGARDDSTGGPGAGQDFAADRSA